MKFILSMLIFAALPLMAASSGSIVGRVFDVQSGEPLAYTNIFLANTTFGDAADEQGAFVLDNIPSGRYQLIVSRIGYALKVLDVQVKATQTIHINVGLQVKTIAGKQVVVTAKKSNDWKKDLYLFKNYFLGDTPNAHKCKIVNPEVLTLNFDKTSGSLKAVAERPLRIENQALGYHIEAVIQEFQYGFKGGHFIVYTRFTEIDNTSLRRREKWQRARRRTFIDSQRGLFWALSRGCVAEYFQLLDVGAEDQEENKGATWHVTLVDTAIGLYRFEDSTHLRAITTRGDASDIVLKYGYVDFDKNGNVYPPDALIVSGYWTKNRMADVLPNDYAPQLGK